MPQSNLTVPDDASVFLRLSFFSFPFATKFGPLAADADKIR